MPISLVIQWRAWWKLQGPPAHLQRDLHAALLTLEVAKGHVDPEDAVIGNFLQPYRKPSDFRPWANLGPDECPEEYEIDN